VIAFRRLRTVARQIARDRMSMASGAGQGFGFGIGCVVGVVVIFGVGGLILVAVLSIGSGGGSADLGELRVQCTEGNGAACDALYLESPVGSEDEAYGLTCGNRTNVFVRVAGASCANLIEPESCIGILCDDDS
jgi:hypothetical protein